MASYKDIDLNMNAHPVTGDVSVLIDKNAVINSLKNIILDSIEDYVMTPQIGVGVEDLLFENQSPAVVGDVEYKITQAVQNFEPRADLDQINVVLNQDSNQITIDITFYILNDDTPTTTTIVINRLR